MTIYTKTVTLAAGATTEVFTEFGVPPENGEVLFQLPISGGASFLVFQLSDSLGVDLGPYVPSSHASDVGSTVILESRVPTDKDPVYFTNTAPSPAPVLIAFFPRT